MRERVRKESNTGRKIMFLVFVFVAVFLSVFFAARGRLNIPVVNEVVMVVVSPFQNAFAWISNNAAYVKKTIGEIRYLHKQNKQLREEVELLRAQNLTATEAASENQRLRALLGYKQVATQFDLVAARVIGRESETWSSTVVINRGTSDGVADNMAVVTEMGLVGHVAAAGFNTSKVRLILDPRSSVGTLVQRPESRVAGIVVGDINNPTMPRMINIPKNADVKVEDVVVTSGFGGVYPKGIVVGKIMEIKNDDGGLLKYGMINPSVNFEKLEDVAVIIASRETPPQPVLPPAQTPGTETDPVATAEKIRQAREQVEKAQQEQKQQAAQQAQQAQPQSQPQAGGAKK